MKSDLELKADVMRRLELEPKIDPTAVGVSVDQGVVTLRGVVEEDCDRLVTERALRDINGVKGLIDDDLQVRSARKVRPKDAELEAKAAEAIQWLTTVPTDSITLTARNGWLTLEGEVECLHQSRSIEELLKEIAGVRGVRNNLSRGRESRAA